MQPLTPSELANWGALYVATSLCCAIAAILATVILIAQLAQDRPWRTVVSWRSAVVLIPATWWHWQRLYLLSTPVTLAIVGGFAVSMSWN